MYYGIFILEHLAAYDACFYRIMIINYCYLWTGTPDSPSMQLVDTVVPSDSCKG